MATANVTKTQGLVGVHGWLMVLVIYLGLLNPIIYVLAVSQEALKLSSSWNSMPTTFAVPATVNLLVGLGLTLFGMYSGIAIKNVRQKAIQQTKAFLFASIVWTILFGIFVVAYGDATIAPSHVRNAIRQEIAIRMVLWIAFYLTIYAYLVTSNRVQATFGKK